MARTIASAEQRRQRLRDEFLTPEERGQRKEKEILAAKNEVNRNRVLGFISEEQAQWEQKQLDIALHRHRLAEEERRRRAADAAKPMDFKAPDMPALKMPEIEEIRREISSTVTYSGAALLASGQGGGSPMERIAKAQDKKLGKVVGLLEKLVKKEGQPVFV
jgi:hypothetical protein